MTGHFYSLCIVFSVRNELLLSVYWHLPNPGDDYPSLGYDVHVPDGVPSVGDSRSSDSNKDSIPMDRRNHVSIPTGYSRNHSNCSSMDPIPKSYPNRMRLPIPNGSSQNLRCCSTQNYQNEDRSKSRSRCIWGNYRKLIESIVPRSNCLGTTSSDHQSCIRSSRN